MSVHNRRPNSFNEELIFDILDTEEESNEKVDIS